VLVCVCVCVVVVVVVSEDVAVLCLSLCHARVLMLAVFFLGKVHGHGNSEHGGSLAGGHDRSADGLCGQTRWLEEAICLSVL